MLLCCAFYDGKFDCFSVCRKQMEIHERGGLALRWVDFALLAVLGHGPSPLLPPLFPGRYFQLDANR